MHNDAVPRRSTLALGLMAIGYNWVCPGCGAINVASLDRCAHCSYDARSLSARIGYARAIGLTASVMIGLITCGAGYIWVQALLPFTLSWYVGILLILCGLTLFAFAAKLARAK
jgi:hypothetical protein